MGALKKKTLEVGVLACCFGIFWVGFSGRFFNINPASNCFL